MSNTALVSLNARWAFGRVAVHLRVTRCLPAGGWPGAYASRNCTLVSPACVAARDVSSPSTGPLPPPGVVDPATRLHQAGQASRLFGRPCRFARQPPAATVACGRRRWLSSWAALGLDPRKADAVAVKKAYFEAARACHPDLHGATPANIQRFQDLSLAVDSILRELAGDNKGRGHSCAEDGVGAATGGSASAEVSHDDPDFASSFYEFINREMSDATRNEIKAAVSLPPQTTTNLDSWASLLRPRSCASSLCVQWQVEMGGGGLDRGGWWAAAQQMAHDADAAINPGRVRLADPSGTAAARQTARGSAAPGWKRVRGRRRR